MQTSPPADSLYHSLNESLQASAPFALPKRWEKHHHLHIILSKSSKKNTILHISPDDGIHSLAIKLKEFKHSKYREEGRNSFYHLPLSAQNNQGKIASLIPGKDWQTFPSRLELNSHQLIQRGISCNNLEQHANPQQKDSTLRFLLNALKSADISTPSSSLELLLYCKEPLFLNSLSEIEQKHLGKTETHAPTKRGGLSDLKNLINHTAGEKADISQIGQLCADSLFIHPFIFLEFWKLFRTFQTGKGNQYEESLLAQLPSIQKSNLQKRLVVCWAICGELNLLETMRIPGIFKSWPANLNQLPDFMSDLADQEQRLRNSFKHSRKEIRTELEAMDRLHDAPRILFEYLERVEKNSLTLNERVWSLSLALNELEKLRMSSWKKGSFFIQEKEVEPSPALENDSLLALKSRFKKL